MSRFDVEGFNDPELDYYSRTLILKDIGVKAQRLLKKSSVCIVGLGGLGSPVAMQLASLGVGRLRIVDGDVVEISNLQRQNLYGMRNIGLAKVESAAKKLSDINPFITVEPLPLLVNELNADSIVEGMDLVVGALDSMKPRYALNRACVKRGIPFVHGAAIGYIGNVSTIVPGETACLECFQGGLDDASLLSCAVVGVHPSLVNVIGSIMASEVVRQLTGKALLKDQLLFVDFMDLSFEKVKLRRVDNCSICGDGESKALDFEEVLEICGREGRRAFVFNPRNDMGLVLLDYVDKVKEMGFDIVAQGNLGFTFINSDHLKGSILKSGVTILEGFKDKQTAQSFHDNLLACSHS